MIGEAVKRWARRWWPVEAVAYLVHNNLLSRINYSGANLKARPIDDAVNHVRTIAARYRAAAQRAGRNLLGMSILEIGPGDSLGVALCLVAWGASEVVCVDRFDCLDDVHESGRLYRSLLSTFSAAEQERIENLCPWVRQVPVSHVLMGAVTFLPGYSLETCAPRLLGRSFDAILSNAALEHVLDVDRGLRAVMPLLAPRGWMFHEIDFRSHGRFDARSPLWFLTVPEWWWRLMTSRVGAPNRLRASHFRRLFRSCGFTTEEDVVETFTTEDAEAVLPHIAAAVGVNSVEDLSPAVVRFTLLPTAGRE